MSIGIQSVLMILGITISACTGNDAAPQLATNEAEEIGVCGANADPSSGVICSYSYYLSVNDNVSYSGSSLFEMNSLDYVHCTWTVPCSSRSQALSTGGSSCLSVLGTGCGPRSQTQTITRDVQMPTGSQASDADKVCQGSTPTVDWGAGNAVCAKVTESIEQLEDLCCLPRMPSTGSGSGSTGTGSDAGSIDAGSDGAGSAG